MYFTTLFIVKYNKKSSMDVSPQFRLPIHFNIAKSGCGLQFFLLETEKQNKIAGMIK